MHGMANTTPCIIFCLVGSDALVAPFILFRRFLLRQCGVSLDYKHKCKYE